MRIGIVTDTNLLKIKKEDLYKNKGVLTNVDFFYEYIEDLKNAKKGKEIIYYMPKFIIEELIFQKKEAFEEQYKSLKESFEKINYAICGDLPLNNIENILNKEIEENSHKYKLVDLECSEGVLKKLIDDAINKRPPFDKTKEGYKTDSGFKDALIWNAILYSKEVDICEKFYFMSCDKIFYNSKEELESEFKEFHPNVDIKIVWNEPDGSERHKSLQELIDDNGLIETDTIKLYNESLLVTYITQLKYNYEKNVMYNDDEISYQLKTIMFDTFNENDFNIIKVKQFELNKFEVEIELSTNKYEIVEQIEERKKIPVVGNVNLIFTKEHDSFSFDSYIITSVEFYQNPFSKFILSFSNALRNSYIHQVNSNMTLLMEKLKEAISPMQEITKSFSESSVSKVLSEIGKMTLEVQKNSITNALEEKDDVSVKNEIE